MSFHKLQVQVARIPRTLTEIWSRESRARDVASAVHVARGMFYNALPFSSRRAKHTITSFAYFEVRKPASTSFLHFKLRRHVKRRIRSRERVGGAGPETLRKSGPLSRCSSTDRRREIFRSIDLSLEKMEPLARLVEDKFRINLKSDRVERVDANSRSSYIYYISVGVSKFRPAIRTSA